MAITINEEKIYALLDGTEFSTRPLKISLLREFMAKFDDLAKVADDNGKSMDVLMACVQVAMKQYKPDLAGDLAKLEELLDLPTVYKIVEEASGINLSDASLLANITK
jgi:hypothetical protein